VRRTWVLLLGMCVGAGCGAKEQGEPLSRMLKAGDDMVFARSGPGDPAVTGWYTSDSTPMPFGTVVRVVSDPGPETDSSRMVQVFCVDGPARDKAANVSRYELRPR